MRLLLPLYDGTFPLTKSTLNALASRYLATSCRSSTGRSQWIGCLVRFLEEFLLRHGSTLSYADCVSRQRSPRLLQTGVSIISREPDEAQAILVTDKLRNAIGSSVYADLASRGSRPLVDIIESGAKGNASHIVQNVGMVGQQFDAASKRPLALQSHDVSRAERRGLVLSSFSDGLGPIEFFHHLTSSRIGLIGTAASRNVSKIFVLASITPCAPPRISW